MKIREQKKLNRLTFVLFIIGFLSSCGGGGSDGGTTLEDTSTSEWDSMVWDQDDWG